VLVHPAIKKAVCEAAKEEKHRAWLSKIRAYWGHHAHFHIRISCPKGSAGCDGQPSVGSDDGCGAELTRWLKRVKPPPKPLPPGKPRQRRPITLDQLPADCRIVLNGGPLPTAAAEPAKVAEPAKPAKAAKPPSQMAKQANPPAKKATVK
jgi:penicillin-insensitive murein endopeptidase